MKVEEEVLEFRFRDEIIFLDEIEDLLSNAVNSCLLIKTEFVYDPDADTLFKAFYWQKKLQTFVLGIEPDCTLRGDLGLTPNYLIQKVCNCLEFMQIDSKTPSPESLR